MLDSQLSRPLSRSGVRRRDSPSPKECQRVGVGSGLTSGTSECHFQPQKKHKRDDSHATPQHPRGSPTDVGVEGVVVPVAMAAGVADTITQSQKIPEDVREPRMDDRALEVSFFAEVV